MLRWTLANTETGFHETGGISCLSGELAGSEGLSSMELYIACRQSGSHITWNYWLLDLLLHSEILEQATNCLCYDIPGA